MNINILEDVSSISGKVRVVFLITLLVFIVNMTFPQTVKAEPSFIVESGEKQLVIKNLKPLDLLTQRFIDYKNLPVKQEPKVLRTITVIATAYSSTIDQCDSTPCITANGFNVCKHGKEDVIAANFLRFGTKVRIPELYGDKVFTVQDRMNRRYNHRIDLWKKTRNEAISFGKRLVKIEVIE